MVGNRSRGDASRRDSESPRREGRRQDRLGRVLGSMLGSAQTVKTNPGSQEIEEAKKSKSMNQRLANRFGGCTHSPVERHSVVVPSLGPTLWVWMLVQENVRQAWSRRPPKSREYAGTTPGVRSARPSLCRPVVSGRFPFNKLILRHEDPTAKSGQIGQ